MQIEISFKFMDDKIPGVTVRREFFNEAGEHSDDIYYQDAVEQSLTAVRAAILAEYGYDKPGIWEPILKASP